MGKKMISVTLPSGAVATFRALGVFGWLNVEKQTRQAQLNDDTPGVIRALVEATLLVMKPAGGTEKRVEGRQGEFEGALLDAWFETPADAQVYFEVVQKYHSAEENALGKALATVSVTTA